jgi:uncharacterized protein (TIGR02996 family)
MLSPPEGALRDAILDAPDDDGPRLIYADWLEEHGEADRAEFIRVQIALARGADDPRAPAWWERQEALLAEHRGAWLGPLRGLFYLHEFRRGFLEEVTLKAQVFLDHAGALFRAAPVRLVRLLKGAALMGPLADCPALRRVAELRLTDNLVGDDGVLALAASPHLAGLTTLRLGNNGLGDRGAEALAGSPHLAGLTTLNLSRNTIGDRGVLALARSPHLARLSALDLRNNQIGDAGVRALAESPHLRGLRALDLSNTAEHLYSFDRQNVISPEEKRTLRHRFGDRVCLV